MTILEEMKNKSYIDVEQLFKRLARELSLPKLEIKEENGDIISNDYTQESKEQLEEAMYDTLLKIVDVIKQRKIPKELYTTWLSMTKDYWRLSGYDKLVKKDNEDVVSNNQVKSIQVGDTTTTFLDKSSSIEINGVQYNTGTIDFSIDVLAEKYKKDLYRHRKM